jgi:hypothetical protein
MVGAAAGSCTRTCALAGRHSAVESQPQKIKRAGSISRSRPVPFQPAAANGRRRVTTKNKHLLLSCDINPRFHGGSFGVWGHTSRQSPWTVKSWYCARVATRDGCFRADHTGGAMRLFCCGSDLAGWTSPGRRLSVAHRAGAFRCVVVVSFVVESKNKKPCLLSGKQGMRKSGSLVTCLPPVDPSWVQSRHTPRTGEG